MATPRVDWADDEEGIDLAPNRYIRYSGHQSTGTTRRIVANLPNAFKSLGVIDDASLKTMQEVNDLIFTLTGTEICQQHLRDTEAMFAIVANAAAPELKITAVSKLCDHLGGLIIALGEKMCCEIVKAHNSNRTFHAPVPQDNR